MDGKKDEKKSAPVGRVENATNPSTVVSKVGIVSVKADADLKSITGGVVDKPVSPTESLDGVVIVKKRDYAAAVKSGLAMETVPKRKKSK